VQPHPALLMGEVVISRCLAAQVEELECSMGRENQKDA